MGLGSTYLDLRDQLTQYATESLLPLGADPLRRTPLNINAGSGFVFVSRRGDIFPSGFMPLSAGNIRQESLVDIYRTAPLFQQLRQPENLQGRCGACEFNRICGGSRSRAYAMTGNPVAEEPFCTYIPGSFAYPEDVTTYLMSAVS
jgi:AdoMet-dependent heme synthase